MPSDMKVSGNTHQSVHSAAVIFADVILQLHCKWNFKAPHNKFVHSAAIIQMNLGRWNFKVPHYMRASGHVHS